MPTDAASPETADITLDVAIAYIEGGIDCTPIYGREATKTRFGKPVTDPGKQPVLPDWQNRRLSVDEYRRAHRRGDNVGVVTGKRSGLICIDCDRKDDPARNGMAWFEENEARLGQFVREDSPRGGVHLWYRYPIDRDFVPSKGRLFPGVDFFADNGRQIVTWPSIHPNGIQYRIQNGLTLLDVFAEAGEPPAWVIEEADLAYAITMNSQPKGDVGKWQYNDTPQCIAIARDRLLQYPPAIEGEGGDFRTVQAVWVARDVGLSIEEAFRLMAEVYNPRCEPPWDLKELSVKTTNAYTYAKLPPGTKGPGSDFPEEDPADLLTEADRLKEEAKAAAAQYTPRFPVPCAQHFLARNDRKVIASQDHLHQRIQLFIYTDSRHHWQLADDEGLSKCIFNDIKSENSETAKSLKPDQLKHIGQFIKLSAPTHRLLRPDTWLSGETRDAIACKNGIVDIATGGIVDHTPEWFSFTTLPFDYMPGATCPEFLGFLNRIWDNDQELVRSLQLWIGYVLTSKMSAQKFALFKGSSRGGKGTLCRIIEALVGESNYAACTLVEFGDKHGMELLLGKRVGIFSDVEEKVTGREAFVAADRIIQIVGNDPVPVNRKNRDMITMVMPVKIILTCNTMPPLGNRKNALTNRMIIFPFWKSFSGKEDEGLQDRMRQELPGIFNWAMEGAKAILAGEKLFQAAAAGPMAEEVAELLDPLQAFISEAVVFTNDTASQQSFIKSKQLYDTYKLYCKECNQGTLAFRRFVQDFKAKVGDKVHAGRSPDRTRQKGYYGIAFNQDFVAQWDLHGVVSDSSIAPTTSDVHEAASSSWIDDEL